MIIHLPPRAAAILTLSASKNLIGGMGIAGAELAHGAAMAARSDRVDVAILALAAEARASADHLATGLRVNGKTAAVVADGAAAVAMAKSDIVALAVDPADARQLATELVPAVLSGIRTSAFAVPGATPGTIKAGGFARDTEQPEVPAAKSEWLLAPLRSLLGPTVLLRWPQTSAASDLPEFGRTGRTPSDLVKELVDAGVHFGHRVSRWNPKMEPYIHGKRNMIHIIDVKETVKGLLRAKKFLAHIVAEGKDVLFVGTKRQARHAVEEESKRSGMHYVAERWLGGTLTNFATIRKRLNRLDELEKLFTTGEIEGYSKKMKATLGREMTKIKANLEGIRRMEKMPGAMFIVDTRREHIAVKEAKKLGVPVVALIDTDSDPDLVDLPIPGNDDAMKAVEIVMQELAEAIIEAKGTRPAAKADGDGGPRRRSARSTFRAEDPAAAGAAGDAVAEASPATDESAAATTHY